MLRYIEKTADSKKYPSWQWRTHHQHDLGHKKVDLELGNTLWCMRTRLYVALGELKAKTLVERYAPGNRRTIVRRLIPQELKPRIIAMADRHFNDAATQNRWHADQWSDDTFTWWVS